MNKEYRNDGILYHLEVEGEEITFPLHNQLHIVSRLHNVGELARVFIIEMLWMKNCITQQEVGVYLLPYEMLYECSKEERKALELSGQELELRISDIGNIGSSSYRILWECQRYKRSVGRMSRYENVVFVGKEQFLLTRTQWEMIKKIEMGKTYKTLEEQFRLQAQIMEQKGNGTIVYPNAWELSQLKQQ